MKTLFEKMRDNRPKLERAKQKVRQPMTVKEAQILMNSYRRDALDGIGMGARRSEPYYNKWDIG